MIDPRHLACEASDRAAVERFHAAGLVAGGRDHGAPGLRKIYHPDYSLFPNVQLNVGATGLTAVRTCPDPANPGRSISRIGFYAHRSALEANAQLATERARIFGDVVRDEDYAVAEGLQVSAEAGLQEYVLFGRNEPALHHYHNTYREALGMEPLELIQG